MPNKHLKPDTLFTPEGNTYTQIVTSSGGTTVHIAGQVAFDTKGNVIGIGDLKAQAEKTFGNLRLALAAAGASIKHLVRMRYYVVDYDPACLEFLLPAVAEFFGDTPAPASTLVGVSALYVDGLLIEIDATAVI
jgi:enamine deaminase RidA (YjgF/YER057c/UK114 family)